MKPALRCRTADIRSLATQYDYGIDDEPLKVLAPKVVEQQFLTKQQLRVVAKWKAPRSAGYMERNQSEYVKEVTAIALRAVSERARIETLTLLDGVSPRGTTTQWKPKIRGKVRIAGWTRAVPELALNSAPTSARI
jgi:hypothetical protein